MRLNFLSFLRATKSGASEPFHGWRMVALAFLSYNCALGLVSGAFGPLLPALQRELGATRAEASMPFGLMLLAIGVLAPLIGNITRWVSLRRLMMAGAALNAIGFLLLAYARSMLEVDLVFGLIIGGAGCIMGVISSPTLISRWFEAGRGKALGLGMMPAFILIAPPIAAHLVGVGGPRLVFLVLAGVFVAMVPALLLVVDRPEDIGQSPRRAAAGFAATAPSEGITTRPPTAAEIFLDRRFWLLSLAIGILTAAGITIVSHGAAMASEKGISLALASIVLSAYGGGSLAGALGFGWLIDRIGPFFAMLAGLSAMAVLWLVLPGVSEFPLMALIVFLLGTGGGATVAFHTACMTEIFGTANLSRALGYSYLVKVPFLFAAAPLAGRLFDVSGGYVSTELLYAAALALASAMTLGLAFDRRKLPAVRPAVAKS